MASNYLKPSTKGFRQPLDNGSQQDMVVNPPRWAEIGGLSSAAKAGKRNAQAIRKPGQSEHK